MGKLILSGEDTDHCRGVGFLLSRRARAALMGYYPVSSRIIAARFESRPLNVSIVQVYAPTADSDEEEINQFYESLEHDLKELAN